MREVIATGKTVEEATANACAQLGLSRDEVSIEILEMPVKKLFRSIPAKVKATSLQEEEPVAPAVPEAPKACAPKAEEPKAVKAEPKEPEAPQAAPAEPAEAQPAEAPKALSEQQQAKVQLAVEYLADIFAKMGVADAVITPIQQGEATVLKVEGEKVGAP